MKQSPDATPLRTVRIQRNLSQRFVANAVGMGQGYYSQIERGDKQASPRVAALLETFFAGALTVEQILYPARFATAAPTPTEKAL